MGTKNWEEITKIRKEQTNIPVKSVLFGLIFRTSSRAFNCYYGNVNDRMYIIQLLKALDIPLPPSQPKID